MSEQITKDMIIEYLTKDSSWEKLFLRMRQDAGEEWLRHSDIEAGYGEQYQLMFAEWKHEEEEKYPSGLLQIGGFLHTEPDRDQNAFIRNRDWTHMKHRQYFMDDKNIYINKHQRYLPGSYHDHEFIEMCYIFTGDVQQSVICSSREEQINLHAGDLLILPPMMSHKVEINDSSTMINLVVNKNTFEKTFLQNLPPESLLYRYFSEILFSEETGAFVTFTENNKDLLDAKLLDLLTAYMEEGSYRFDICDRYLGIFFLYLLRGCPDIKLSSQIGKGGELIARMLMYLEQNFAATSLEELAKEVHYSKAYCNRIFKEHTGTTIQRHIQNLRLEESCHLLRSTRLSVEDIAERVGYVDESYFIELFRRNYGCTPRKYRARENENKK